MQKILITGASGFIGSFFVEEALARGYEVWAGVRSSSSREYLQDERINFIDLKFANRDVLDNQLSDFKEKTGGWDFIIHNLGATKVNQSSDFDLINFQFTKNFADALIATKTVPDKFVFISSLGVCGPFGEGNSLPITLDYEPKPNTDYGRSKRRAELYLEQLSDFPYVTLRPTGVYGPREKDYFLMIKTISYGLDFAVGYKPQYLTFIYVKDLVNVAFLAINKDVTKRTFFVSDGKVYLTKNFRRLVMNNLGKKRVIPVVLPVFFLKVVSLVMERISKWMGKPSTLNSDKYNIMKQRNWNCDINPLKKELEFTPKYDLDRGLLETINWYKKNHWL